MYLGEILGRRCLARDSAAPVQRDKEEEQRRTREEPPNHKVDRLLVHQVAALMNEAREENLAPRMHIRASRPEIIPSAPEDRYKVV